MFSLAISICRIYTSNSQTLGQHLLLPFFQTMICLHQTYYVTYHCHYHQPTTMWIFPNHPFWESCCQLCYLFGYSSPASQSLHLSVYFKKCQTKTTTNTHKGIWCSRKFLYSLPLSVIEIIIISIRNLLPSTCFFLCYS